MTASTEVAEKGSALPALANTPAGIDGSDITIPRLYIAQDLSAAVQEGAAKKGDLYVASGQEDPDPAIVYDASAKNDEGILVLVLDVYKSLSGEDEDGDFATWAWNDPDAPKDAWKTFNFTFFAPEFDEQVPIKASWTRSQTNAAKLINTQLLKHAQDGPAWSHGFRITTIQKKNPKGAGTYTVPRVVPVPVTPEQIEAAGNLASLLSSSRPDDTATGSEPAI